MSQHRLLDLGIDDVHQPGAVGVAGVKPKADPSKPSMEAMGELKAKKRSALPTGSFADPENRKYPIHDKAHADNAAARLEQQKGSMSPAKYASIKRRVKAAQRRFGEKPKGFTMRGMRGFRLSIDNGKSRIEVRHMGDSPVQCLTVPLVMLSDDDRAAVPVWNQIAKPGRFFKDGSWFELTQQVFSDIMRNFNASQNQQVPVDFEHASEMRGSEGTIPVLGAPAQGWIKQLEMRGSELFGLIEWNELGRQYIRAKQYKFLSPAVRFGCKSATTSESIGARLTSAALTNTPFLDGMQAVAAKDQPMSDIEGKTVPAIGTLVVGDVLMKSTGTMCYSSAEYMPQIRTMFGLGALATAQQCRDTCMQLREHLMAAGGNVNAAPTGVRLADYLMPMREMLRPPFGSSFEDMLDIVDEMIDHAIEEHNMLQHGIAPDEEEMTDQARSAKLAESLAASDENQTPAHGGDPLTPNPNESDTAMSDQKDVTIQMKDMTIQLKDLETEKMRLMAEAKEHGAQLLAKDGEIKTLSDKVTELNQLLAKQADQALETEVDNAILSYKDSKGIKAEDKPELLKFLKNAPEVFRRQYPQVPPARAHLMRDIATGNAGPGANGGGTKQGNGTPALTEIPSIQTLTDKYVKEGKTLDEAVDLAYTEHRKATSFFGN